MKRPLTTIAWLGRLTLGAVMVGFFVLVATQFTNMIARNVATAGELRTVEHDLGVLRVQRADRERDIRRLSDPRGAIPEIHDRLRLTGPHEAIIYLKGAPAPER